MEKHKLHSPNNVEVNPKKNLLKKYLKETYLLLTIMSSIFILISLYSYNINNNMKKYILNKENYKKISNYCGIVGLHIANILYYLFGYFSFFIPIWILYITFNLLIYNHKDIKIHHTDIYIKNIGFFLFIISGNSILTLNFQNQNNDLTYHKNGILGKFILNNLEMLFNKEGTILILTTIFLISINFITKISWTHLIKKTLYILSKIIKWTFKKIKIFFFIKKKEQLEYTKKNIINKNTNFIIKQNKLIKIHNNNNNSKLNPIFEKHCKNYTKRKTINLSNIIPIKNKKQNNSNKYIKNDNKYIAEKIKNTLLQFSIKANVVNIQQGPIITRFELQLYSGTKIRTILSLSKDLARLLSVTSIKIIESIPKKTTIGLELPNKIQNTIKLSDILLSKEYQESYSPITIGLGVNTIGNPVTIDLKEMPHILIAGTTGSGKSMNIHSMILSILLKSTPKQVQFIMIDPKIIELSTYNQIPHLLMPVITEAKKVSTTLNWIIKEMKKRFHLMNTLKVRNIEEFNKKNSKIKKYNSKNKKYCIQNQNIQNNLPYIIIIIDELADIILTEKKNIESLIVYIAQKSRASGIHFIISTQRPSVNILTGIIKANIPARIAFQVSSKIDSYIILDQQGAEQLLGKGDMLYLSPQKKITRIHGPIISNQEINKIINYWINKTY
ncbi:DNA translocase FtsK [Candidatus Legionella polyplacis]|uniref:DNA translocase FtsK 4TM domain-containing protein n=1 Tax=Candidatus Legionella polyplacis TaxID=2005262 RepID=A0ABZ2GXN8_9GAMM